LESEFTCGSEFAKRTIAGVEAGFWINSFGEEGRQGTVVHRIDVEDLELSAGANALGVGSAGQPLVLLGGNISLHSENVLDDLVDDSGFRSQVPLRLASGNPEPSSQE
jgi:hypothetical protein